jgi:long-chain fatty acid transport protein
MTSHWKAALSACASIIVCSSVLADGVILQGISPRALGRGGTNQGFADNGGVLHDNPGAMTNVAGQGLVDVGMVGVITQFDYTDPSNNVSTSDFCPLPQLSYIRKSEDGIWAYGIGTFVPAGFSEKYNMIGPAPFGGPQRYQSYGALMKVLPGLACQVTDQLSIGGTFGLGVSYSSLEGPYTLQNAGPVTGFPTLMKVHGTGATPVWSLGSQYLLTDTTTLGATYTSVSNFNLDGNTTVVLPGIGASTYHSTLEAKWPQSVAVGLREQISETRVFSTDVIWYDWSSAFNNFTLNLNNPGTPGFPPVVTEHFPLRWRDSYAVRLGMEQKVLGDNTLRLGYIHNTVPVPNSTITPFLQATLEHSFSIGYGTQWNGWNVDAGYMYLFGPTKHVGASSFLGGDFDNATHRAQAHAAFLNFIRPF